MGDLVLLCHKIYSDTLDPLFAHIWEVAHHEPTNSGEVAEGWGGDDMASATM